MKHVHMWNTWFFPVSCGSRFLFLLLFFYSREFSDIPASTSLLHPWQHKGGAGDSANRVGDIRLHFRRCWKDRVTPVSASQTHRSQKPVRPVLPEWASYSLHQTRLFSSSSPLFIQPSIHPKAFSSPLFFLMRDFIFFPISFTLVALSSG